MRHAKRYVCTECGHEEKRSLAPIVCPSCDSQYVVDEEAFDDEDMNEHDISALISRELKAAANG